MPIAVFERRDCGLVRFDENLEISKNIREQAIDLVWTEKVRVLATFLWKVAWSDGVGRDRRNIPCP